MKSAMALSALSPGPEGCFGRVGGRSAELEDDHNQLEGSETVLAAEAGNREE